MEQKVECSSVQGHFHFFFKIFPKRALPKILDTLYQRSELLNFLDVIFRIKEIHILNFEIYSLLYRRCSWVQEDISVLKGIGPHDNVNTHNSTTLYTL